MEQQELEVNKDKLIYIRWALIFASYHLIEKWDDTQRDSRCTSREIKT